MIKLNNINKYYHKGNNKVEVLKSVNCNINKGEMVALMGRSGSGKTTLINILSGLLKPNGGSYIFDSVDILQLSTKERDKFREKNVGIIVQDYALINSMTAYDNIILPIKYRKEKNINVKNIVKELSEKLHIQHCLKKKVYKLSGGESQRVAIARALIKKPTLILADEPTGALDSTSELNIMDIFKNIKLNCTIIIATHSPLVASYCDRTININNGIIGKEEENESKE